MRVYILDTTALLTSHIPDELNVTCNRVIEEVKNEISRSIVNAFIDSGKLIIKDPDEKYVKMAEKISRKTGDYRKLSLTDLYIIALAIEYNERENYSVYVITDDYAIQNILSLLNIEYLSCYRRIRREVMWIYVCSKCGKEYPPDFKSDICPICGGKLIRKRYNPTDSKAPTIIK